MRVRLLMAVVFISFPALLASQSLPTVSSVEYQPLAAQVSRVLEALDMLGEPLPARDVEKLKGLVGGVNVNQRQAIEQIQGVLDQYCLAGVNIDPENRLQVQQGPAKPELVEQGWRTFLVKVRNGAGTTAVLAVDSPNAGQMAGVGGNDPAERERALSRRFLDVQMFNKQPLRGHLSGLELEYRILQVYSRDPGKFEGRLVFDVGLGTATLNYRSEVLIAFEAMPATKVTFRVLDVDGRPTTAAFWIRDSARRVYPSQAKRLAPDFAFQTQVYRTDGEFTLLPKGEYTIEYGRGPEYVKKTKRVPIEGAQMDVTFQLERWIDPAKMGWYSGDHHIHAAGCAHYDKPTEGVYPSDMMRHILGEDLKIGSVLTWGPGWYFQKTFFEGKENSVSTKEHRLRYDMEVSGFPSSHAGHLCLLGLKEQDYPNTKRVEDWPSWGLPVLRWAKRQGAVVGYAHSGWGLALKEDKIPSYELPPFDGIGANEYIVSVTHDLVDFISAVDTPPSWELNVWYHTLNVGYRTRISGETDFPCIYGERMGMGRSYVRQPGGLDYKDWAVGIREGRSYVSDGMSHLLDFKANGVEIGAGKSELRLAASGQITVTAQVAALLEDQSGTELSGQAGEAPTQGALPSWMNPLLGGRRKPYWELARARIGNSRNVPLELVVNGKVVASQEILADGMLRPVSFTAQIDHSSWVALRILPSSHTNPIFVIVGGKPIRASRASAEWCLRAVDQCWTQKAPRIRAEDRAEAERAYEFARQQYRSRLKETVQE